MYEIKDWYYYFDDVQECLNFIFVIFIFMLFFYYELNKNLGVFPVFELSNLVVYSCSKNRSILK